MTATEEYLAANERYAAGFSGPLPLPPSKRVAVLACMDARLDVAAALGISEGEAHVIRNAGGVVTDDAIRSLAISQHLLGTEEVVLVHHTDCGMLTFTDEQLVDLLAEKAGARPEWTARAFTSLADDVRDGARRIRESPFVPRTDAVRGFVFDVASGRLDEVDLP